MSHLSGRPARIVAAAVAGMTMAGVASAVGLGAHATASVTVNRVAGSDRYQTSAMIAEAKYPTGVPGNNVVLATGLNFPDALAGNYLAGQLGAPILLTPQTASDPAYSTVTTALGKLLPGPIRQVTILGGTSAVGSDVSSDLQSKGYLVSRIGGATRYDTAQMVDTQSGQTPGKGASGNPTAILATGQNFPDALAGGPLAWKQKFPIVLTDGSRSSLSPQAQSTLTSDKIQNVLIMGGSAAINPGINTALAALGIKVDKQFAGADRTDTAAQLATYAQSTYSFGTSSLILASGQSFADALSAGPWGGDPQDIYLTATTDSIGTPTTNAIKALSGTLTTLNIAGGTSAVDNNASQQAQAAAQNVTSNATYTVTPAAAQTVNTSAATHGNAVFQVANLGTQAVDIVLFNCANVQSPNGSYDFAGTNPGGSGNAAVPGTVSHETITVVNGAAQSSPATVVNGVNPSGGALSFTVANDGTPGECVVPVVFQKTSNDQLSLGAGNGPTVPFGAGGPTTFVVPATAGSFGGGAGSTAPTDSVTSFTAKSFTTSVGTYTFSAGDTYQLFSSNGLVASCTATTMAAFQGALSAGDKVGGNYQPGATSTFCLNDIAPGPPGSVTATQNAAAGGVSLAFIDSPSPEVTGYNVYRALSSNGGLTGAPSTCPTLPAPMGSQASPQTAPSTSTSWTKIGGVADLTIGSAAGGHSYTFNDPTTAPSSGTAPLYCYAVAPVTPSAAGTQEGTGAAANTNSTASSTGGGQTAGSQGIAPAPAPTSSGAPAFKSATAQGQTVTVTYNQNVNAATLDKGDFTVTYGTTNNGTGTQTADSVAGASGSGTTVYVELANAVPSGDFALVKSATGSDSNTVCAAGGTSSCQTAGDQVISAAATAAGAAPAMQQAGSTASSSTKQVIVKYSSAIDCSTVDSGDWSVTSSLPVSVTGAACSDAAGAAVTTATSQYVTITTTGFSAGSSLSVKAQNGTDGNTVIDPATGAAEATTDQIMVTAT